MANLSPFAQSPPSPAQAESLPTVYSIRLAWTRTPAGWWPIVTPLALPAHAMTGDMIALCYRMETDAHRLLASNLVAPYPDEQETFDEPIDYEASAGQLTAAAYFSRKPLSKLEAAFLCYRLRSDCENIRLLLEAQTAVAARAAGPSVKGNGA